MMWTVKTPREDDVMPADAPHGAHDVVRIERRLSWSLVLGPWLIDYDPTSARRLVVGRKGPTYFGHYLVVRALRKRMRRAR